MCRRCLLKRSFQSTNRSWRSASLSATIARSASLSATTVRSLAKSNFRRISLVLAFLLITTTTGSRCQIWIYPIFPVRILLYILSLHMFLRPFSPPPLGHPSTSTWSWPYGWQGAWVNEILIETITKTTMVVTARPNLPTWTTVFIIQALCGSLEDRCQKYNFLHVK